METTVIFTLFWSFRLGFLFFWWFDCICASQRMLSMNHETLWKKKNNKNQKKTHKNRIQIPIASPTRLSICGIIFWRFFNMKLKKQQQRYIIKQDEKKMKKKYDKEKRTNIVCVYNSWSVFELLWAFYCILSEYWATFFVSVFFFSVCRMFIEFYIQTYSNTILCLRWKKKKKKHHHHDCSYTCSIVGKRFVNDCFFLSIEFHYYYS